jgi:hypothetical protein
MLCARCLAAKARTSSSLALPWRPALRWMAAIAGFLLVWVAFQFYGQHLASLPDDSHQDVLWRENPLDAR